MCCSNIGIGIDNVNVILVGYDINNGNVIWFCNYDSTIVEHDR